MTKDGYECYQLYLALQRHFSTTYDFHKYNGKVKASVDSYKSRNDMFAFEKMAKIVKQEDRVDFFVSHFLKDPKCWIKNMSKPTYEEYKERIKNFPIRFKEDLQYISHSNPKQLFSVTKDIPEIHKLCLNRTLSLETLVAIDKFFPFIDKHKKEVSVPIVFPDHIDRLINYRPFFENKVTDIHKDVMKQTLLQK